MKHRLPRVVVVAALASGVAAGWSWSQSPVKTYRFRPITSVDGKDQYIGYYCLDCHGEKGKGDGPDAARLKMPVPDLTTISARNNGKFPSARVAAQITRWERVNMSKMAVGDTSETMPLYGPVFFKVYPDSNDRTMHLNRLVDYIKSLQEPPSK